MSIHEITGGKVVALLEKDRERAARELLVKSDQIVFAGDPDPSGAIAFRELLLHLTNLEQADRAHPALMLATMTEDDVALAFEQGETTNDAAFSRRCIYGEIKRYFDYN
ncbi:DNA topoisomerase IA [Caballeronia udeis]|uniref:DNA topoisomerase IA n=1 Tax=Caballeronia udeis TaxID=1232866 RepID=A0ABW8MXB0_9BURK